MVGGGTKGAIENFSEGKKCTQKFAIVIQKASNLV